MDDEVGTLLIVRKKPAPSKRGRSLVSHEILEVGVFSLALKLLRCLCKSSGRFLGELMDKVSDPDAKQLIEETVQEAKRRLDPSSGPSLMYARNPDDVSKEVQDDQGKEGRKPTQPHTHTHM